MSRLIALALTLGIVVGNNELTFTADCRSDTILPCFAFQKGQKYISIMWYKIHNNSGDKSSMKIVAKSNNSALMDKNGSLVLRNVSTSDSGIYKCVLKAMVGQKNCEKQIRLNISDCALTTTPASLDSSTVFINGSLANMSIPLPHIDDNSELFVIWGYVGLAMSKVVLCAVCIWGFNELRALRKRRLFS